MRSDKKKPIYKNCVPEHVEKAVVDLAIENPALGQLRASQELSHKSRHPNLPCDPKYSKFMSVLDLK